MDFKLLESIKKDGGSLEIIELTAPRIFAVAVGKGDDEQEMSIICNRKAVMVVELHVRHGTNLVLRNVHWMVTDQNYAELLLSRPVL